MFRSNRLPADFAQRKRDFRGKTPVPKMPWWRRMEMLLCDALMWITFGLCVPFVLPIVLFVFVGMLTGDRASYLRRLFARDEINPRPPVKIFPDDPRS